MTPSTMRAWRTHEYGEPGDRPAARRGGGPRARRGRGTGPRPWHPAQPQRPRAHHRRQHDGAARPAVLRRAWRPWASSTPAGRAPRPGPASGWSRITQGAHGGFAEYSICPAVSLFDMPDDIPLPDAAALFFPFHLAWLGLFDRAELQAGETVLIHAAAGGSGSAAIQLAVDAGRPRDRHRRVRGEGAALPRPRRRDRRQLPHRRRSPPVVLEQTDGKGRRRRLRQRGRRGHGRLAELHRLQRPLPHDGVRLGQDGRRREVDRPAQHRAWPTSSSAACCCRTPTPSSAPPSSRRWGGTSRPTPSGPRSCSEVLDLVRKDRVRAVVGRVVDFEDVPAAFEAMANRETVGRTIVKLWPD